METNNRFPQRLGNLAQTARFPHSHKPIIIRCHEQIREERKLKQRNYTVHRIGSGPTRGVLAEEFGAAIVREARLTGEAVSDVRQRIERDPVELAKIAAVALDALALKRPIDRDEVLRRLKAIEPNKREP